MIAQMGSSRKPGGAMCACKGSLKGMDIFYMPLNTIRLREVLATNGTFIWTQFPMQVLDMPLENIPIRIRMLAHSAPDLLFFCTRIVKERYAHFRVGHHR